MIKRLHLQICASVIFSFCIFLITSTATVKAQNGDAAAPPAPDPTTQWVTADSLGSGWGMYPITNQYGGTKPLSPYVMWATDKNITGRQTWLPSITKAGVYHFWVRRYGGYGSVEVAVNEKLVKEGGKPAGGSRYVWQYLGHTPLEAKTYHFDILVHGTMFDSLLITQDEKLNPQAEDAAIGEPVKNPALRAPRTYRDDSSLQAKTAGSGLVIGRPAPYSEHQNDWLPTESELLNKISFWGSAGQYASTDFAFRSLSATGDTAVTITTLQGPKGHKIDPAMVDLRIVALSVRPINLFPGSRPNALLPDFLVYDDRQPGNLANQGGFGNSTVNTRLAAHQSRQFKLVVGISATAPAGVYKSQLDITTNGRKIKSIPVELEVLPLALKPVEGFYGSFYRAQPVTTDAKDYVTPEQFKADLEDQVRHGLNTTTLYGRGGLQMMETVAKAGMTGAPWLMQFAPGAAGVAANTTKAKELGLADLYYYSVDEPNKPEQIERARNEGIRREKIGAASVMAINSKKAMEELTQYTTHPIFAILLFSTSKNPAVAEARKYNRHPISYWMTHVTYPMYFRSFAGLYNTACGYEGTAPWAYFDQNTDKGEYNVVEHDQRGLTIPSLRWEAWRDGIDDVRYLQTLDRAIASGKKQIEEKGDSKGLAQAVAQAQEVRKMYFDPIGEKNFYRYLNSVTGDELETTRRAMAEATIKIETALR